MRRALLVALACAGCQGEIVPPPPLSPEPLLPLPGEPAAEDFTELQPFELAFAAGDTHFQTVTWDTELGASAALDVRPVMQGSALVGVEVLNPRFALAPGITSRLGISNLSVLVEAPSRSVVDAYAKQYCLVDSERERTVSPGLLATAPATSSPVRVWLRFAARSVPPPAVDAGSADDAGTAPADAGAPLPDPLEGGRRYQLICSCGARDRVVAVEGAGLEDGAAIVLTPRADGHPEQIFQAESRPEGGWMLVAQHSGRALNVPGGALDAGVALIQWQASDASHPNQRFDAERLSDGTYRFTAVHSGLALQGTGAVVQEASADTCEQRFELKRIE